MRSRGRLVAGTVAVAVVTINGGLSLPAVAGVAITGRHAPAANAGQRVGAAPVIPAGAHPLGPAPARTRIRFDITLRPRNPAGLTAFATAVSTPGSASYHHFLSTAQFAARFGQPRAVVHRVAAVLARLGLAPGPVSANSLLIPVTSTVGRAAAALHSRFRAYRLGSGRLAYANTAAPLLPASIAPLLQGVIGLNDLASFAPLGRASRGTPTSRRAPAGSRAVPSAAGPQACAAAAQAAQALHGWTYTQLAQAYSFTGLYQGGQLGAGTTVAIFELEPWLGSDITKFQQCYGTTAQVSRVDVDGGAGTGPGSNEAALDIETVIALAPKAKLLVYDAPGAPYATSALDDYTMIVDQDRAQVLSSSVGGCESWVAGTDPSLMGAENTVFEQAATEGISVLAAAGDTGSEGCLRINKQADLAVLDPAAQPFVTGVGGTELTALGPAPAEQVWNDPGTQPVGAGGGGISSQWPMPAWQAGPGVISGYSSGTPCQAAAGDCREVPDVSASADFQTHGYIEFYNGKWIMNGGTSAATPLWAALVGDIDSQGSPAFRAGFLNPRLYSLPAGSFNDIKSGDNDFTGKQRGKYPATAAYDMASGLGSPIATKINQELLAWRATEAPMPANESPRTDYAQVVQSVVCPAVLHCDAYGLYTTTAGDEEMQLSGSGSAWTSAEDQDSGFSDIACQSAAKCVEVGITGFGSVATGSGLKWTPHEVTLPANASPNSDILSSVTCPSLWECVALGDYQTKSGADQGLIVTGSGSKWTSAEVPLPANAAANPYFDLGQTPYAIACTTASSCVVIGDYGLSTGGRQGVVLTGSGKSWTATQMPLPANAAKDPETFPLSVACPSASSCVVVGGYTSSSGLTKGLLLAGSGTSWTAIVPPLPRGVIVVDSVYLNDVSCPSAASCTVVGSYVDSSGSEQGLVLTGSASSWTASETPLPGVGFLLNALGPIVCVSAQACLIAGAYLDSTGHDRGLLLTGAGTSWTAAKAPVPANSSTSPENYIQLESASCSSVSACVVVGDYTDTSGDPAPLILDGPIR